VIQDLALCPCCSGKDFLSCCKDIVAGTRFAATPLELMRSRYTAHVCKDMPHNIRTMRGKALKLFDEEKTYSEWFELSKWQKLEILDAPEVEKQSKDGIVEFKAYYSFNDTDQVLHERSKFTKENNQWFYVAGQQKKPIVEASVKVGRNDDCPCGSGSKYKKCCSLSPKVAN
jgi:SEC-C motif-containing protein